MLGSVQEPRRIQRISIQNDLHTNLAQISSGTKHFVPPLRPVAEFSFTDVSLRSNAPPAIQSYAAKQPFTFRGDPGVSRAANGWEQFKTEERNVKRISISGDPDGPEAIGESRLARMGSQAQIGRQNGSSSVRPTYTSQRDVVLQGGRSVSPISVRTNSERFINPQTLPSQTVPHASSRPAYPSETVTLGTPVPRPVPTLYASVTNGFPTRVLPTPTPVLQVPRPKSPPQAPRPSASRTVINLDRGFSPVQRRDIQPPRPEVPRAWPSATPSLFIQTSSGFSSFVAAVATPAASFGSSRPKLEDSFLPRSEPVITVKPPTPAFAEGNSQLHNIFSSTIERSTVNAPNSVYSNSERELPKELERSSSQKVISLGQSERPTEMFSSSVFLTADPPLSESKAPQQLSSYLKNIFSARESASGGKSEGASSITNFDDRECWENRKRNYSNTARPERSSMRTPGRKKPKRTVNFNENNETIAVSKYIGKEDEFEITEVERNGRTS